MHYDGIKEQIEVWYDEK